MSICVCWSLGHAEQLFFSKVTYMSSVKCQLLSVNANPRDICFQVYAQKWHVWNACVDPWTMLNNFCFHVYAQKSLFIGFMAKWFVFYVVTLPCEWTNHRTGSQLKHNIFQRVCGMTPPPPSRVKSWILLLIYWTQWGFWLTYLFIYSWSTYTLSQTWV